MNVRLTILSALAIVGAVVLSITGDVSDAYWGLTLTVIGGTVGTAVPASRKEN